jgi:hypothetical protein
VAGGDHEPIDFSTFVLSLSSTALSHLGDEGQKPDKLHLALARQTIDVLELLEQKTTGNLDADEERLLKHVLAELRIEFVKRTKDAT